MKGQFNSKLVFFLIPLITFLFGLYLLIGANKREINTNIEKTWLVNAQPIEKTTRTPTKLLYGKVITTQKAKIASEVSSDVIAVNIKEGLAVKKNNLLIKLDPNNYQFLAEEKQAEIKSLTAQKNMELTSEKMNQKSLIQDKKLLLLNQKNLERLETLRKKRHSSRAEVDNANKLILQQMLLVQKRELDITNHKNKIAQIQAKISKATAQYKQAKNNLNNTIIKAPFDGLISKVNVSVGTQVYPQTPLVSLYDLNEVYVQAQISHKLQPRLVIAMGNKVPLFANPVNYPKINLKLDRLASEVEDNNANIKAFFKVPKSYAVTTPLGLSVSLLLKLPQVLAYQIPVTSMHGNDKIYIINNDRLKQVRVKRLGSLTHEGRFYLLIDSPELKNGDKVLTTKLSEARTGMKVKLY